MVKLEALRGGKVRTLSDAIRVIKVDIWEDVSQKSFGALKSIFQCFDILRGRVASSIRWLVICTVCI